MDPIWPENNGHVVDQELSGQFLFQRFDDSFQQGGILDHHFYEDAAFCLDKPGKSQAFGPSPQPHLLPINRSLPLTQKVPFGDCNYDAEFQGIKPQSSMLSYAPWTPATIPSSSNSTISSDMPGLTSSSASVWRYNRDFVASDKLLDSAMFPSHKSHSSRTSTSFSHTPIKQRKLRSKSGKKAFGAARPKSSLTRLEVDVKSRHPKLSKGFFAHLKLLVEKEIEDGNLEAECEDISITSSSRFLMSRSEISDAAYQLETPPNEAGSLASSTPRPLLSFETTSTDVELETRVRYYCTYPNCKVQQKECKYKHKKCSCPAILQRYWSESKVDIKRHEEGKDHYQQETFACIKCFVTTDVYGRSMCKHCFTSFLGDPLREPETAKAHFIHCEGARANTKVFGRKDRLLPHLKSQHGLEDMGECTKAWGLPVEHPWPRQCGFCPLVFDTWDQRMSHIAWHFENKFKIEDWRFPFIEPKDKKNPDSFFFNHRKDKDDDDNDDGGFGGGGGSYGGKFSGYGSFSGESQTQYGQFSSSQDYGSYQPQNDYQQNHRGSQWQIFHADHTESSDLRKSLARPSSKLTLALARYLIDPGDRVPGLGTAQNVALTPYLPSNSFATWSMNTTPSRFARPLVQDFVIVLRPSDCEGKVHLVRHYITQHWNELDNGIFWLCDYIRPEVKDSLYHIAVQTVFSRPAKSKSRWSFYYNWWRDTLRVTSEIQLSLCFLNRTWKDLLGVFNKSPRRAKVIEFLTGALSTPKSAVTERSNDHSWVRNMVSVCTALQDLHYRPASAKNAPQSVSALHSWHQDLKPDNILCVAKSRWAEPFHFGVKEPPQSWNKRKVGSDAHISDMKYVTVEKGVSPGLFQITERSCSDYGFDSSRITTQDEHIRSIGARISGTEPIDKHIPKYQRLDDRGVRFGRPSDWTRYVEVDPYATLGVTVTASQETFGTPTNEDNFWVNLSPVLTDGNPIQVMVSDLSKIDLLIGQTFLQQTKSENVSSETG